MYSQTDACVEITLEFVQKIRSLGFDLQIHGLEPILPSFGIPLHGDDHFCLLVADLESQTDKGDQHALEVVLRDYPHWAKRIRDHLDFGRFCRKFGPAMLASMRRGEKAPT